jgi:hypothetical protein
VAEHQAEEPKARPQADDIAPPGELATGPDDSDPDETHAGLAKSPKAKTGAWTDTDQARKETGTKRRADDNNTTGELAKGHNKRNARTLGGPARSPTEEDSGGSSDPPRSPTGKGVAELNRKAAEVEAEIRKLNDDVGRAERSLERQERRLEDMVEEERVVWEGDRRTQEKMGTLYRAFKMTRHGAMMQRRDADNMTREAAGQGLAEASARAIGQADRGGVKEQVEEKLRQAERQDKEAAKLDI